MKTKASLSSTISNQEEIIVVLNPWQTMMAATLYSLIPDLPPSAIIEWDPFLLKKFALLRQFKNQLNEVSSWVDDLFIPSLPELASSLEKRIQSSHYTAFEPIVLLAKSNPKRLILLTESLPPDSFWQVVSPNTEVFILIYETSLDEATRLADSSSSFCNLSNKTIHILKSPADLILKLLQLFDRDHNYHLNEIIVAGDNPDEILTGLFFAIKSNIPLVCARRDSSFPFVVSKHSVYYERDTKSSVEYSFNIGEPLEEYKLVNEIGFSSEPRFTCLIEQENSLAFVTSVMYALNSQALAVVYKKINNSAREESIVRIKAFDKALTSENPDRYEMLDYLSDFITEQISENVISLVAEHPNVPIQIIGSAFPYSLCKTKDKQKLWSEVHEVAYLPMAYWSNMLLRNYEFPQMEEEGFAKILLLIDTLSLYGSTEGKEVLQNLSAAGYYCIYINSQNTDAHTIKSILKEFPVDICWFITHGDEASLILHSDNLSADDIGSIRLETNSLVINNSCLSWTGVGEAFVKSQARGYLGTYWSIEHDIASCVGSELLSELLNGHTISSVLRKSIIQHPNSITHLAYLYVGFLDTKISNASGLVSNKLTTFAKLIQKIGHISNYDCDIVTAKRLYQIALDSYSCNLQSEEFPISLQASIQFGHFNLLMGVHAHHKNQDLDELIEIGESTVKILRSVNDKSQLYRVLSHIAAVNLWKGNLTSAESLFLEAVEIERSLGHNESVARDLGNLGILYEKQGRIKLAIEYHEKALSINSKLANDRDMLLDHQRLAFCNLNLGNIANSLRHLNMVLEIHKWRPEINRSWIFSFLDSYSIALIGSGNSKEALTVVDHLINDISELIKAGYDIEPHEAKCMISGLLTKAHILYAQNDKDGARWCISAASSTAIAAQLLEEYLRVNLHMIKMLDEINGPNSSISLASELLSTINQSDRQNLSDELVSIQNQLLSYLSSARPDNLGGV